MLRSSLCFSSKRSCLGVFSTSMIEQLFGSGADSRGDITPSEQPRELFDLGVLVGDLDACDCGMFSNDRVV